MKTSKLAAHGGLLALGMFLYSGVAIGAFQHFFFIASTVWMTFLVILGLVIRRRCWPTSIEASKVVGFGLLGFFAILLMIGLFPGQGIVDSLWNNGLMMASIYGIWFWLPFIIGAALGGINHRKVRIPSKPAHPTTGNAPV